MGTKICGCEDQNLPASISESDFSKQIYKVDSKVFKDIRVLSKTNNKDNINQIRLKQIAIKNQVNKIIRAYRSFHARKNKKK